MQLPIAVARRTPTNQDVPVFVPVSNKTDNYSVDQLAGNTTFSNGATLTCRGFFMGDGYLVTNGTDEAKIAPDMGYNDSLVRVEGGIMYLGGLANPAFGKLTVQGDMVWTGGTYEAYLSGSENSVQSVLTVTGELTAGGSARIHTNLLGNLGNASLWSPIQYGTRIGNIQFSGYAGWTGGFEDNFNEYLVSTH